MHHPLLTPKCSIRIFEVCRNPSLVRSLISNIRSHEVFGSFSRGKRRTKLSITIMTFPLRQFQVLKNRGFSSNGNVITFVLPEWRPADRHVPTMQITIDTESGQGNGFLPEIVAGVKLYFPFGRYV